MTPSAFGHSIPSRLPIDICSRYPFGALVEPRVGLIDNVRFMPIELGEPELETASASLGNLSMSLPHVTGDAYHGGSGGDPEPELAWVRAVVEAAERYAVMAFAAADFTTSTAKDLGPEALSLAEIPSCSNSELQQLTLPAYGTARGRSYPMATGIFVGGPEGALRSCGHDAFVLGTVELRAFLASDIDRYCSPYKPTFRTGIRYL